MFSRDGRCKMDVERCNAAGNKVNGALTGLMRRRNVSTSATRLSVHNADSAAKCGYYRSRMKER